jgi:hypothetical protein
VTFNDETVKDKEKVKESLKQLFISYMKKYPMKEYIVGYEEVSEHNRHIHAHVVYSGESPKKQTISDFMKKAGYSNKYQHKAVETTDERNKLYVVKDLDILLHNLSEEQMEELMEKTEVINESKKKQSRDKVLDAFKKHMEQYAALYAKDPFEYTNEEKLWTVEHARLSYIAKFINKLYINEWNKEPPFSRMKALVIYVGEKYSKLPNSLVNYERSIELIYESIF